MLTVESLRNEVSSLIDERNALAAARYAYATELPLDKEGQPDVGSIHQNIRALKAAAKLALNALIETRDNGLSWDAEYDKAIKSLKKANVQ